MNKPDRSQAPQPRPIKAEIPPREPIYVYHWNRIIGMITVLVLITAAGGYGLSVWLESDNHQEQTVEREIPIETAPTTAHRSEPEARLDSAPTRNTQDGTPALSQTPPQPAVIEQVPAQEPPAVSELSSPTQTEVQAPVASDEPLPSPRSAAVTTTPVPSNQVDEVHPQPSNEEVLPKSPAPDLESASQTTTETPTPLEQSEPASEEIQTNSLTNTAPSSAPFQLQDLHILNPQVIRFELPRNVINKEPQGELNEIDWKPNGSVAVWCYSEVTGRRGSVLRYVWYFEGKRIARVLVNVRGNRWRSYSSKLVNQRHLGDWRVELQDSKERVLARAEFKVR